MTRDSVLLKFIVITSIITGVLAGFNPSYLGLSDIAAHWISAISAILAGVSGYLQSSPLPGANDANTVSSASSKLPVILLAVALGGLMMSSACGGKAPAQLPAAVSYSSSVVQSVDAKVKAIADRSLGVLGAAGALLDEVIKVEKTVEPLMSTQVKADTRKALNAVNDQIENAAKAIKTGVRDEAGLKAIVDPVLASAQSLSTLVSSLPQATQSQGGFGAFVESLLGMLLSNLGAFHGAPLTQGAL